MIDAPIISVPRTNVQPRTRMSISKPIRFQTQPDRTQFQHRVHSIPPCFDGFVDVKRSVVHFEVRSVQAPEIFDVHAVQLDPVFPELDLTHPVMKPHHVFVFNEWE